MSMFARSELAGDILAGGDGPSGSFEQRSLGLLREVKIKQLSGGPRDTHGCDRVISVHGYSVGPPF